MHVCMLDAPRGTCQLEIDEGGGGTLCSCPALHSAAAVDAHAPPPPIPGAGPRRIAYGVVGGGEQAQEPQAKKVR